MKMILMRKLFKNWWRWLTRWGNIMRMQGSRYLRLVYLLILSKMEKLKNKRPINKKLCSKIFSMVSRRSMMKRSKMHQKFNRKRKTKESWRSRNFRRESRLSKGSTKRLVKSKLRNSKKIRCKSDFIQVETWAKQVLTSSYRIRIIGRGSAQEKIHWNRNTDDNSQAKDRNDELI